MMVTFFSLQGMFDCNGLELLGSITKIQHQSTCPATQKWSSPERFSAYFKFNLVHMQRWTALHAKNGGS